MSADTLIFINCKKCEFHDSIHLKPNLQFYIHTYGKTFFELGFNSHWVNIGELSCNDIQYGYWALHKNKTELTLKFVTEKTGAENFKDWKVIKKNIYLINLTPEKLILMKKK